MYGKINEADMAVDDMNKLNYNGKIIEVSRMDD